MSTHCTSRAACWTNYEKNRWRHMHARAQIRNRLNFKLAHSTAAAWNSWLIHLLCESQRVIDWIVTVTRHKGGKGNPGPSQTGPMHACLTLAWPQWSPLSIQSLRPRYNYRTGTSGSGSDVDIHRLNPSHNVYVRILRLNSSTSG